MANVSEPGGETGRRERETETEGQTEDVEKRERGERRQERRKTQGERQTDRNQRERLRERERERDERTNERTNFGGAGCDCTDPETTLVRLHTATQRWNPSPSTESHYILVAPFRAEIDVSEFNNHTRVSLWEQQTNPSRTKISVPQTGHKATKLIKVQSDAVGEHGTWRKRKRFRGVCVLWVRHSVRAARESHRKSCKKDGGWTQQPPPPRSQPNPIKPPLPLTASADRWLETAADPGRQMESSKLRAATSHIFN